MAQERHTTTQQYGLTSGAIVRYKEGALVFESGDYECMTCGDTEYLAAGSEVPECANCMDGSEWVLVSSEADSEDG